MQKTIAGLLAGLLTLAISPSANADTFSYDDKSQIVVTEITFSSQTINTRDNDEPITINVKAYDTFNPFRIAVAQFYSEKAGHIGFAQANPIRSTQANGINTQEFVVNITIPKSLPEGILYLILRFDSNKPDGSFWQTNLYAPVAYVPAGQPFPGNLTTTITNSYSAESVGAAAKAAAKAAADKAAAKAAADRAAADKAAADKAAADKAAADKAALDKAIADKAAADKAALDKAIADKAAIAKTVKPAQTTIMCIKGKTTATIKGVKPKCPAGFKKKP
jgi:hypothetical protein